MIDYGRVKGMTIPTSKIIDDYSVWVHTNVTEVSLPDPDDRDKMVTLYEYDKVCYTKDEYIKMIDDKNETLEKQVTDTQLALVEIYEKTL